MPGRSFSPCLTEQLAARILERIRGPRVLPGAGLPSIGVNARLKGVIPHIVMAAYDQLLAQGLVGAGVSRGILLRSLGIQENNGRETTASPSRLGRNKLNAA